MRTAGRARAASSMHRRAALLLAAAGGLGRAGVDGDHVVAGLDQRLSAGTANSDVPRNASFIAGPYRQPRARELGMRRQWIHSTPDHRPLDHRQGTGRQPRRPPRRRRGPSPIPCRKRSSSACRRSTSSSRRWPTHRRPKPGFLARLGLGARGQAADGPARALHLGTGRPRQVDADGPVLRRRAGGQEAPRAFPRVHARGAGAPASPPRGAGGQGRAARGRHHRADRQARSPARRGCSASTSSRSPTSPTR